MQPLVSVTGLAQIALAAGFPGILDGSVGGYLEGSLGLDLNAALGTDYKLYVDQVAAALANNPFQMFTTSGEISAGFSGEVTVPLWGTHTWDPKPLVLLDLSPSTRGSAPPSTWTISTNGGGGSPPPNPLSISAVTIPDNANTGDTLTAVGGQPNDNTATVTYQWQRGAFGAFNDIAGANGSTYQLTQADLGSDIQVVVTATRASDGSSVATTSNSDEPYLATYDASTSGQLDVTIPDGRQYYSFFSDGNGGVIIQAFGQSQDYANVTLLNITGGSTGDDTLVFDQALTVPTDVSDSGSGNLAVYAATNDVILYTGSGTFTVSAAATDIVHGGSGTNYLNGTAGNDSLIGGSGVNVFQPGPNDIITGGSGSNIISFALSPQAVNIDLSQATPVIQSGDAQGDTFTNIQSITAFQGSNFGDTFKAGSQGVNFTGGTGNDTIIGGPGDDVLQGGGGFDTLTGGGGSDLFIFGPQSLASSQSAAAAYDTVTDYNAESDEIIVSGIVGTAAASGDPATSLVRIVEDDSGTFANLQVNPSASSDSGGWTTIAHLDGLAVGDNASVLLNGASPVSVPVQVEQLLYVASAEVNGTPTYQLMIQQGSGADHVLKTLGTVNFNGDSRDYATQYLQIGNQFYFAADIGPYGNELWTSDGTAAGTHLVQDINPGSSPSYPSDFFAYDGKLAFVANDGTDGNQVWITDGTTTTMLTDISGGIQNSPIFENISGTLYFAATDNSQAFGFGQNHNLLYQSDGTPGGTIDLLANVNGTDYSQSYSVETAFGQAPIVSLKGNFIFPAFGYGSAETSNMYVIGPGVTFGQTTSSTYFPGEGGGVSSDPVLLNGVVYFTAGGYEDQTLLASNGTSFTDDFNNNLPYPSVPLLVSLTDGDGNPTLGYNIQRSDPRPTDRGIVLHFRQSGSQFPEPPIRTRSIPTRVTNCGSPMALRQARIGSRISTSSRSIRAFIQTMTPIRTKDRIPST